MKHKEYSFNLDTFDKDNYEQYCELAQSLRGLGELYPWEDIKVGDTFHIPPLLLHGRREFVVEYKLPKYLNGKIREEGGFWRSTCLYIDEVSRLFLVKKIN